MRIFERYTLQDVLGEVPIYGSNLREKLDSDVSFLIKNLHKKTPSELKELLSQHLKAKQEMTKFSGAMALDQSKIEMFHEFLAKYISEIESIINSK